VKGRLVFDNGKISDAIGWGGVGEGFGAVLKSWMRGRISIGALSLGIAKGLLKRP